MLCSGFTFPPLPFICLTDVVQNVHVAILFVEQVCRATYTKYFKNIAHCLDLGMKVVRILSVRLSDGTRLDTQMDSSYLKLSIQYLYLSISYSDSDTPSWIFKIRIGLLIKIRHIMTLIISEFYPRKNVMYLYPHYPFVSDPFSS
jgi:hypothetical protein